MCMPQQYKQTTTHTSPNKPTNKPTTSKKSWHHCRRTCVYTCRKQNKQPEKQTHNQTSVEKTMFERFALFCFACHQQTDEQRQNKQTDKRSITSLNAFSHARQAQHTNKSNTQTSRHANTNKPKQNTKQSKQNTNAFFCDDQRNCAFSPCTSSPSK